MNFLKFILNIKTYLVEYILKYKVWLGFILSIMLGINFYFNKDDNIEDLVYNPFLWSNPLNLIDTNELVNKILSFINNLHNLDIDSQLIMFCVILLLINFIYFAYIISFIVAPSIFDIIKDYLPIKVKEFLIKYISINRKISIPFVILCSIFMAFTLLFVIFILTGIVILNNFN